MEPTAHSRKFKDGGGQGSGKKTNALIVSQIKQSHDHLGGIDFNSANLNLQIKYDGRGVPLPLAQQDMAQLSAIQGFEPEILEKSNLP